MFAGKLYLGNRFTIHRPSDQEVFLELPSQHTVPLTWLLEHGSASIRARVLRDLAPEGFADPRLVDEATAAVVESPVARAVVSKQGDDGVWAGNLLGVTPAARSGIRDVGTIPQYRRLLELGYPRTSRPFKLADRVLFRLLSRDNSPELLFEYARIATDIDTTDWARAHERIAATAALAEAGYVEDPRVRGAAHKIATDVSDFMRSPLADNPYIRSGGATLLHPDAYPPTWYLVAMIAAMPNLRRERAGFTERLAQYLGTAASKRAFSVQVGRRKIKGDYLLLGNPIEADSHGHPKDLPLALHALEQLARIGALVHSPVGVRVMGRLLSECDPLGVWRPKRMPTIRKAIHPAAYHSWGLQEEAKSGDARYVETTFRLALVAKKAGWELTFS